MIRHSCGAVRWRHLAGTLGRSLVEGAGSGRTRFREAFAGSLGVDPGGLWLTGSGRTALHAMVASLALGPSDEVLLPGYTCVVVPNVFKHLGLPVRYVDVAEGAFNPSIEDWVAAIGPATRVVVLPHNFGTTTENILELRERFAHVVFIEDVAHAWGSRDEKGRLAGTSAQAAFFSFEYSKCLTTGLGGALLVNDPALRPAVGARLAGVRPLGASSMFRMAATLVYHLLSTTAPTSVTSAIAAITRNPARAFGWVSKTPETELRGESIPEYDAGLGDLQAWLGVLQVREADAVWALRRRQAADYSRRLAGSSRFVLPPEHEGNVLLRYPLRLQDPGDRSAVIAELQDLDIEAGVWFDDVVHPRGSARYGYRAGDCPRGEALAEAIINLPLGLHATLSESQWKGLVSLARSRPWRKP